MKKFLAILMSLALTVSALACGGTTLFADGSRTDVEAVFDSETGETPNTSVDAWGFIVVGGSVWGNDTFCGVSVEKLREYIGAGYSIAVTYSGTPGEGAAAVLNGDFDNGVKMTTTDLGNGRYESTISLKAVLDAYGKTADEVEGLAFQSWTTDFKLYHVEYYRQPSAESETPAAEEPEASSAEEPEAPAAEEPETPAADEPEAPASDDASEGAAETPAAPNTGITLTLAALTAALAAVAAAASKRR